jgi:hypothetical protein
MPCVSTMFPGHDAQDHQDLIPSSLSPWRCGRVEETGVFLFCESVLTLSILDCCMGCRATGAHAGPEGRTGWLRRTVVTDQYTTAEEPGKPAPAGYATDA